MPRNFFITIFAIFLLSGVAFAADLPSYSGFVNDFAGVISAETHSKIEGLCKELEAKTSAELAIATVKTTAPLDTKTYAVKLFEKWKIGKKGKDNGLLILLSMDERRVEIEVGYGLEGVINDALAGEILDKYVIPRFKEGDFGEGLYAGAVVIADRIARSAGEELGEKYKVPQTSLTEGNWIIIIIIGTFILLSILSLFGSGIASGLFGGIFGAVFGFVYGGIIGAVIGAIIGFMLSYTRFPTAGRWGGGGFSGGGGGGGFSFGGGGSGGGGAGRGF